MKTPEQIASETVYQHGGHGAAAYQNIIRGIEADRAQGSRLTEKDAARLRSLAYTINRRAYSEGVAEAGDGDGPQLDRRRAAQQAAMRRFEELLNSLAQRP